MIVDVSAAVDRFPDHFRAHAPDVSKRDTRDTGNSMAHQYDRVRGDLIRDTSTTHLPDLVEHLTRRR